MLSPTYSKHRSNHRDTTVGTVQGTGSILYALLNCKPQDMKRSGPLILKFLLKKKI